MCFSKRSIFAVLLFPILAGAAAAEGDSPPANQWITRPGNAFIAPAHRGSVDCVASDEAGNILTAGGDGFLVIWDGVERTARERFQISPYAVEKIALRSGKHEIAAYESDGVSSYRVSVWDYAVKKRLYTIPLSSPVLYCAYTARGGSLLLCLSKGVLLIDSESGEQRGDKLGEYPVNFAVSSRTERTLQMYSPTGVLSYWDLEKSILTQSFSMPQNLRAPLVFGNFRFLAGQNDGSLFVVDAVSGKIFFQTEAVRDSLIFRADDSGDSFSRISIGFDGNIRHENFIVENGIVRRDEILINTAAQVSAAAPFDSSRFLIGLSDGGLALVAGGGLEFFLFKNQRRIFDAASTGAASTNAAPVDGVMAFTDEDGRGAFIPADFNELMKRDSIVLFDTNSANRISTDGGAFLFWRRGGADSVADFAERGDSFPFVKTVVKENTPDSPPDEYERYEFNDTDMGNSLRGAAINGGKVLFLDSLGDTAIFSTGWSAGWRRKIFSYTSNLSLDAIFVDDRNILIARNVENGRSAAPFLLVDSISGETLPVAYPAFMAFALYKSSRGNVYSAVLKNDGARVKTEIVRFNAEHPESSTAVFEYDGEYTDFSFIEYSAGNVEYLVSAAGGEDACIIPSTGARDDNALKLIERTPAFPKRLLSQNNSFAAIDGDGSIAWYDGASGKLLAMLRIYEDEWLLATSGGKTKRGTLTGL
ncbi:MAG: WD40 repeat domain-containing protein [Spirochaetaceae bacterium]|nr:WD40 repeat domain-containing protein [Spirochaetaceae bacterium]